MARAEIVGYQTEWAETFRTVATTLRREMADIAIRINHIGNTAVVGLPAKDIVDIQISVASLKLPSKAADWFEAANLVYSNELKQDHIPSGTVSDKEMWRRLTAVERPGERQVHVHIRQVGSPSERYAVLFRDYLRSNSAAIENYGLVIEELGRLDRLGIDAYKAIKEPTCDLIIQAAERWAEQEAWTISTSDL